ncbi:MAG: PilN domain-containing protein [Undibacterium sp.]|nr:PilN domain-containing protein [Undibacterium sp.]
MIISTEKAHSINQVIGQLNLPWSDLLDALEDVRVKEVALLDIQPQPQSHTIRIVAEAKTSDDMFAYVEKLSRLSFFQSATLSKHEVSEQDPNKPIRFQLDAQWQREAAL